MSLILVAIYVFVLAVFAGFELIARVPPLLHTPLMSGSNAISGIILVGALISAGAGQGVVATVLGVAAVILATINVVGGFVVTDRMLGMFRKETKKTQPRKEGER
jgi:NAD(P) transhydrogenase subunit alpha